MLDKLAKIDTDLLIYLNNLGTEFWDPFWLLFTEKYTHIPFVILLLVLSYRILGLKSFLLSLLFIGLMATTTDQLTNLAKHGFLRPRPCRVPELEGVIRYIAKRCSRYGFFSGHSCNTMAVAIFIGSILKRKYKYAFPTLIIWALAMGYSRIYVGVHYPADLLTGFTVGTLVSYLFFYLFSKASAKLNLNNN